MSEPNRPDPDALLDAILEQESGMKHGRLKVFLGMSAGVGKTYAMLEAAHKAQREGRDVVIGYVESHGRKETDALTSGLEQLPRLELEHRGVKLSEMDLDAILRRKPQLVLVDEFAHSNVPGSRHPKRWQDVFEILQAGIDVYSTLNVQHIESRTDTVRQVTGSNVHETVPDQVLDGAEIELIDLPPEELLHRLQAGKVYPGERAEAALFNFFRVGNLTALREIALRYAAGRVSRDVQGFLRTMQIDGPWKTGDRLMVGISGSPSSSQLVRWTRRLAESLSAEWIAVHVESSSKGVAGQSVQLSKNLALARSLGAEVVTTADENLVRGLLRIAKQRNVSQIVVGKPGGSRWTQWLGALRLHRLATQTGTLDVHLVKPNRDEPPTPPKAGGGSPDSDSRGSTSNGGQYVTAAALVIVVTLANFGIAPFLGYRSVALSYLLAVVGAALFLGRGPIFLAAALSALFWNFFFLPPVFTFYIRTLEDGLMFGMYFVVAVILGQIVARVRAQELANLRREERATALYLLTRELADSTDLESTIAVVVHQVSSAFKAQVALLLLNPNGDLNQAGVAPVGFTVSEKELGVAVWALEHQQPAGRFTDNLPLADGLHLPLRGTDRYFGVLAVFWSNAESPSFAQRDQLDAFARQCALVLDRQRLREVEQEARLAKESERLGKTLLNSISHELRTPLAAIGSALSGLRESGALEPQQCRFAEEIDEASARLNRLVRNLLDVARLESGHLKPHLEWCDPSDLCNVAVNSVESLFRGRLLKVDVPRHFPLVNLDYVLMEQVLSNLLANAAIHTPAGTPVELSVREEGDHIVFEVADHGTGLSDADLNRVFEKFHRASNATPGGTGLGLSIVKGFVEAQSGSVAVNNRPGGGAVFSVRLPRGQAPDVPVESP
jgi:two-component system, OmpR family, sensor histidine kinase KdpD